MNLPGVRQVEAIGNQSEYFFYWEGSFSFRLDFLVVHGFEVSVLEPDFLSFLEGFKVGLDAFKHSFSGDLVCCKCFFADPIQKLESFV